jgi:DNA-binding transcriptional LysR family regulator
MDDFKLRVFYTLAKKKNFSKTAKLLFLTPSAISRQIKSLEEHIGTTLFERRRDGVVLTQAGKLLFKYARQILSLYDKASDELSNLSNLIRGRLFAGASTTLGEHIIPKILSVFKKEHPHIEVYLKIANSEEIKRSLLAKELCIGLIDEKLEDENFESEHFLEDRLILIASKDHPLASREYVTLDDIKNEDFIMREKGSGTRKAIFNALNAKGINLRSFKIKAEVDSTAAVKSAVSENLGVSIISDHAIMDNEQNIAKIPITDIKFTTSFHLVYHKLQNISKTCNELLKFIKKFNVEELLTSRKN